MREIPTLSFNSLIHGLDELLNKPNDLFDKYSKTKDETAFPLLNVTFDSFKDHNFEVGVKGSRKIPMAAYLTIDLVSENFPQAIRNVLDTHYISDKESIFEYPL